LSVRIFSLSENVHFSGNGRFYARGFDGLSGVAAGAPAGVFPGAESTARFPELKESRFAEYFLIGPLSSTALAVAGGVVISYMVYGTVSLK